ncbi:MAG: hypothetical protein M1324_00810 [Patescibacteria group bacterium]|nr:hypothetical protein [Patescibacteria group bacterium]
MGRPIDSINSKLKKVKAKKKEPDFSNKEKPLRLPEESDISLFESKEKKHTIYNFNRFLIGGFFSSGGKKRKIKAKQGKKFFLFLFIITFLTFIFFVKRDIDDSLTQASQEVKKFNLIVAETETAIKNEDIEKSMELSEQLKDSVISFKKILQAYGQDIAFFKLLGQEGSTLFQKEAMLDVAYRILSLSDKLNEDLCLIKSKEIFGSKNKGYVIDLSKLIQFKNIFTKIDFDQLSILYPHYSKRTQGSSTTSSKFAIILKNN